jgi:hypothetical protein
MARHFGINGRSTSLITPSAANDARRRSCAEVDFNLIAGMGLTLRLFRSS